MSKDSLSTVRMVMIAAALIWIAGAGWFLLADSIGELGSRSSDYRREAARCSGSYSSRYSCKSSAMISLENSAFIAWSLRLGAIFGPPFGLAFVFRQMRRRHEEAAAEQARRRALRKRTA